MAKIHINGNDHEVDTALDTPLLWVLRDNLGLMGTKFGCGLGACGACTVLMAGRATRSCVIPLSMAAGHEFVTIEGLQAVGLHPVQRAWQAEDVPQCGYCQCGQIMATVSLLAEHPDPSDRQIDEALTNICRCGAYPEIRKAVHHAARLQRGGKRS